MRAAIAPINPPRKHGMIVVKLAARRLHHADVRVVQFPTGADAIEQDPHFDAGTVHVRSKHREKPSRLRQSKQCKPEIDCFLCAANRAQHCRKVGVAILEQLDFVTFDREWIVRASAEPKNSGSFTP